MNIPSFLIGYQAGKNAGGGSSADVRYVTFMSYDGSIEYGKIPVAVGYDCPNPKFDTPTRESTAQYHYTHYGWATTPNGGADANWNKAITEDKTVYANFSAAVRSYTITYYDGDTVLKTESLAYGSIPKYAPTKDGYTLAGWSPSLVAVTGDASYTAQWIQKLDFSNLTWAQIAEYAEQDNVAELFDLGATKTFTNTKNGKVITARIIGFNHDDKADGSGKAGLTLMLEGYWDTLQMLHYSSTMATDKEAIWPEFNFKTSYCKESFLTSRFPADLMTAIKTVKKKSYDFATSALVESEELAFVPSAYEVNNSTFFYDEGIPYEYYKTQANRVITYNGSAVKWFTRTKISATSCDVRTVNADGSYGTISQGSTASHYPFVCICI